MEEERRKKKKGGLRLELLLPDDGGNGSSRWSTPKAFVPKSPYNLDGLQEQQVHCAKHTVRCTVARRCAVWWYPTLRVCVLAAYLRPLIMAFLSRASAHQADTGTCWPAGSRCFPAMAMAIGRCWRCWTRTWRFHMKFASTCQVSWTYY